MKNNFKLLALFAAVMVYRMLTAVPYLYSNPLLAFQIPTAKLGKFTTFMFGFWSIFLFNIIAPLFFSTLALPIYMIVLYATLYGCIGMVVAYVYRLKKVRRRKTYLGKLKFYAVYGILGLLVYDVLTGVVFPSYMHPTEWYSYFIGQTLFSLKTISRSLPFVLLSPLLEKWFLVGRREEDGIKIFAPVHYPIRNSDERKDPVLGI